MSATPRRRPMPSSAWRMRRLPSKRNGLVTMASVTAPSSRATAAITGAPPVPVPPPSPAVTNTRSAPLSADLSWSREASIASRPTSGSAPPPRPWVISWPMWILTSASQTSSCCTSVLTAMNSTPFTPESTMRLTAFVPAPPDSDDLDGRHVGAPLDRRLQAAVLRARRAAAVGAPEELAQPILHARTIDHSAPPARGHGTPRRPSPWDRT